MRLREYQFGRWGFSLDGGWIYSWASKPEAEVALWRFLSTGVLEG